MRSFLSQILEEKKREVADLKQCESMLLSNMNKEKMSADPQFEATLRGSDFTFIGEIKRKSPSKGVFCEDVNALAVAKEYHTGGVGALSVLTDAAFFSGSLDDIEAIRLGMASSPLPILRKDFIIDPVQLIEAKRAGADAVLLIVRVLKEKTALFIAHCKALSLDAVVEVHHEEELLLALDAKASMILINHRDLESFEEDVSRSSTLIKKMPSTVCTIAASGIATAADVQRMKTAGFDAVLMGEALMCAQNRVQFLHELGAVDADD